MKELKSKTEKENRIGEKRRETEQVSSSHINFFSIRKCRVRISAGTLSVLTEVFGGFYHLLKTNADLVLHTKPRSIPFTFNLIYYLLLTRIFEIIEFTSLRAFLNK